MKISVNTQYKKVKMDRRARETLSLPSTERPVFRCIAVEILVTLFGVSERMRAFGERRGDNANA